MPKGYAEIVITINPIGVEKVEVNGIEDDPHSESMGVEIYQQLAGEIVWFTKKTKEILCSHWANVRKQEGTA